LAACAEPAKKAEDIVIGWIACDFSAPSVARSREGAEAKAAELGIKVITLDSAGDVQKEADNALNLMSQGVDGIIIEPNDMAAFVPIAQQLKEAGIPLIVFCQEFEEQYQDLRICYVGCKDYDCGVFAGEEAIRCLGPEGGNVVIVNGMIGSTPQVQRGKGFRDALVGHDNIVILEEQCSPWDRAKAVEIMEDFITRYGEDIDLVYAMDDNLAIGAVEALRSAGLSGKIPVIGYNGMSDAFDLIKSGEMYSTLIQPLYWGGGVAVQAMYDHLTGKEIEPAYYDTMVNVTAENVDELQPEW
jgi:ribose transport system substrate-binding protein